MVKHEITDGYPAGISCYNPPDMVVIETCYGHYKSKKSLYYNTSNLHSNYRNSLLQNHLRKSGGCKSAKKALYSCTRRLGIADESSLGRQFASVRLSPFAQVASRSSGVGGGNSADGGDHAFTPLRFRQTMVMAGGFCGLRRVLGWTGALGLPKN